MHLVICSHVSKKFHRHSAQRLLREHVAAWWKTRGRQERVDFYALKDVSFEVERGESLAIIGGNGAGKSTLLSLISGLAKPTNGTITVNGSIAPLLQLGAGFHPDLTGAENLFLNASLLGFTKKQAIALFASIVDFAGLADVIDEPLRTYSSGMSVRLAFSIAVNVNPDILIIDEVLGVGDHAFQAKCADRITDFRKCGKTLLFVSHNPKLVTEFCDRALWLDHGEVMMQGEAEQVIDAYEGQVPTSETV